MSRSGPIEAVEYRGVKPGDRCIVMTTSTGRSKMHAGTYLGQRKGNCVVELDYIKTIFVNAEGKHYDWNAEYKQNPYPRARWNTPEYHAEQERYNLKKKELQAGYEYKKVPSTRRSTLQNNNVYPADMALKDFKL
ncbi:hypothetical protein [Xanthomonas phage X1]|nr:hypothetical protein [Xanthomonas phage X1]